jgi:hypothetical protein
MRVNFDDCMVFRKEARDRENVSRSHDYKLRHVERVQNVFDTGLEVPELTILVRCRQRNFRCLLQQR